MVPTTPVRWISAWKNGARAPSGFTMSPWRCMAITALCAGSMGFMTLLFLLRWCLELPDGSKDGVVSAVGEDRRADVGDVAFGGEGVGEHDADHVDAGVPHQLVLLLEFFGGAAKAPVVDELLGDDGSV